MPNSEESGLSSYLCSGILKLVDYGAALSTLYLYLLHYRLPGPKKKEKKGYTGLYYIIGPPIDLIIARIRSGIVLISFCKVTRFISVHCCIHFSPRSCIDNERVGPLHKAFSSTTQRFSMGLRSGICGGQSMCENCVKFFKTTSALPVGSMYSYSKVGG